MLLNGLIKLFQVVDTLQTYLQLALIEVGFIGFFMNSLKRGNKMPNNNKKQIHPMNQELPPVQATIVINFHGNSIVTSQFPTNIALTMFMTGQFLALLGSKCEFKEQSPIITLPKGAKLG